VARSAVAASGANLSRCVDHLPTPSSALDGGLGGTGRVGGYVGLQLSKLSRDIVADQIRVEAQHLAKLDPASAELTQGSAKPLPRGQGSEIRIRDPSNERAATSGVESGSSVASQPSEPVPARTSALSLMRFW
jgi:hypothetical protein